MTNKLFKLVTLIIILSIALPLSMINPGSQVNAQNINAVTFTILHHNDFHGQLEPSGSNPGLARVATVVNNVRAAMGADNVLLLDAGDEMQGSLLSNIYKGVPVIASYNVMNYSAATFGNHEFDWGLDVLSSRTGEATYPYLSANIVVDDTGNCNTAGWTKPSFIAAPYTVKPWVSPQIRSRWASLASPLRKPRTLQLLAQRQVYALKTQLFPSLIIMVQCKQRVHRCL